MTTQPPPISDRERYANAVHNAALLAIVACPILALLPPRKLDIYTIGLVGVTGYSANHLVRESTGRSAWQYVTRGSGQRPVDAAAMEQQPSVIGEMQKQGRAESMMQQTSRDSWKIQRQKEIRDDVDEGKGFGEMIVDQIWEVWNQGKPTDEDSDG